VKFTASDRLAFEDSHQVLHEKSSRAAASPLDRMSPEEETSISDAPWDENEPVDMNYTLASDVAVLESEPEETMAGTGHEGVVDATADISKFPSKNDLWLWTYSSIICCSICIMCKLECGLMHNVTDSCPADDAHCSSAMQ